MVTKEELQDFLVNDSPLAVNGPVDVSKRLYVIDMLEKKIQQIKADKVAHAAFYAEEEDKTNNQIDFIKGAMQAFLANTKRQNCKSPAGSISLVKRQKVNWPDTKVLVQYCYENEIEMNVKVTPIKDDIKAFISDGHDKPEGFSITETTSLMIKKAKEIPSVEPDVAPAHGLY